MIWPNQPTGNTPLAHWLRRLLYASKANQLQPGVNYRVKRTDSGTFLDIAPQAGGSSSSRWHPFKVYVSGAEPSNDSTNWRTFRVRAGAIFFETGEPTNVEDTDGTDDDPDNGSAETGDDRWTVSESSTEYVWIEFEYYAGEWVARIMTGQDPTAAGWDSYPDLDGHHIMIAKITTGDSTAKTVTIRQYLRNDVFFGPVVGICNAEGNYDTTLPQAYKEPLN